MPLRGYYITVNILMVRKTETLSKPLRNTVELATVWALEMAWMLWPSA